MKVRIKTWEEMENDFGVNSAGNIDCQDNFLVEMEEAMPDDRIINIDMEGKWIDEIYWINKDLIAEYLQGDLYEIDTNVADILSILNALTNGTLDKDGVIEQYRKLEEIGKRGQNAT